MLKHKYCAGDRVIVAASTANQNVRAGVYTIVKALPIAGRGCQYRAKNSSDTHERVLDEDLLVHEAEVAAAYAARNEAVLRL